MKFKVFLLFFSVVYCQNYLFEGDRCHHDGFEGVCLDLRRCRSALEDLQNNIYPQKCSFTHGNKAPIVCCVERNPVSPPPVEENVCEPLPEDLSPPKTGQRAFDKCIEYQLKYVYPCEEGVDLLGEASRQNHCHHKTDELIIGGIDAEQYEFPHMVMLGYGQIGAIEWNCAGAIISERFILTAAHCISQSENDPVTYVVVGALRRRDAADLSKIYKVKKIIPHPQYKSPSKYNDIALIETEKTMNLDQYTVPACLHIGDRVNDTKVIAAGWGLTHHTEKTLSEILKRVILSKFSNQECSRKYKPGAFRHLKKGFDRSSQSCYGDKDLPQWYSGSVVAENKDTCNGDSGGPIQIKDQKINCMYTIVGVTSAGRYCGYGDMPGLYTRVAHYLPWIEDIVWPNPSASKPNNKTKRTRRHKTHSQNTKLTITHKTHTNKDATLSH